jgi:hypothetical protein
MKQDILNSSLHAVTTVGDFKSHKAEIDTEDLSWILQILSTNLYSDPIGSLVREYSSNAWDANVEAGNKHKPIEVGIQTDKDQGSYWYVTDLGPGLSPERIDKVYRKFGKSTKRESNEAIGMMGLGKFSGLSYTDQIYITTRFEGMQYQYIMHKADNLPQIDMLSISPTDLPSGTTIKVFIHGGWSERRDFERATREQLAYFENIYFNVDGNDFNNYKIIKGRTFTYSSVDDRGLRIKLGPVTYPIDYSALKLSGSDYDTMRTSYDGIALNFNIGDLAITPNRESILYNAKTISAIKSKLVEFQQEIASLYNTKMEYEDPEEFATAINSASVKIDTKSYRLTGYMRSLVTVRPKLKGFDHNFRGLANAEALFTDYVATTCIQNGKKKEKHVTEDRLPWNFMHTLKGRRSGQKMLIIEKHGIEPKHTKYLMEQTNIKDFTGIRRKPCRLFPPKNSAGTYITSSKPDYYTVLELMYYPKSEWRRIITAFQNWQKEYVEKHSIRYDDYVPTKEWLKEQKSLSGKSGGSDIQSLRKANGKILVKKSRESVVWSTAAGFDNKDIAIKDLPNIRHYVIYGTEESKNELSLLHIVKKLWSNTYADKERFPKFEIWIVAQAHHKYLKMVPSFIHIDDFMKCKDRISIRLATNALLYRKYAKDLSTLYKCTKLLEHVDTDAAKRINPLFILTQTFARTKDSMNSEKNKEAFDTMIDTLLVNATASNMWNFSVTSEFPFLDKLIKEFMFVKLLKTEYHNSYTKETKEFLVEHCKLRGLRMDLKHYQQKQQDELPTVDTDDTNDTDDTDE